MPEDRRINKRRYESPVALPLGEMAKGSGDCSTGSVVVGGTCQVGSTAFTCVGGGFAPFYCEKGGGTFNCSWGNGG